MLSCERMQSRADTHPLRTMTRIQKEGTTTTTEPKAATEAQANPHAADADASKTGASHSSVGSLTAVTPPALHLSNGATVPAVPVVRPNVAALTTGGGGGVPTTTCQCTSQAAAAAAGIRYHQPLPPVLSTSFKGVLPPMRINDYRKISLSDLHQWTFFFLMPATSFVVRALLHPMTVVKTRMMVNPAAPMPGSVAAAAASHAAAMATAAREAASSASGVAAAASTPAMPASSSSLPSVSPSAAPSAALPSSTASSIRAPAPSPASAPSGIYGGGKVHVALLHILRTEGVRGLYSGFGVTMAGLAIGPVYMFAMLNIQEQLEKHAGPYIASNSAAAAAAKPGDPSAAAAANAPSSSSARLIRAALPFVSGAGASCVAQVLGVPLDVVSAKQMRGHDARFDGEGPPRNMPALEVAKKVWAKQGIAGFYKGYWLTLMHNAPMSALVWGTYGSIHPVLRDAVESLRGRLSAATSVGSSSGSKPPRLHPALRKWDLQELATVFVSAGCSAAVAASVTVPLDVIKTRLQASRDRHATVRSTFSSLLAERGWLGLTSGLNARLASAMPTSALLMVAFECLKRATIRADAEPEAAQLYQFDQSDK